MGRPLIEAVPSKQTLKRMNQEVAADDPERNARLMALFHELVLEDRGVFYWLQAYSQQSLGHEINLQPVRLLSFAKDNKIRWVHVLLVVED